MVKPNWKKRFNDDIHHPLYDTDSNRDDSKQHPNLWAIFDSETICCFYYINSFCRAILHIKSEYVCLWKGW